jgi:hypothetical protein
LCANPPPKTESMRDDHNGNGEFSLVGWSVGWLVASLFVLLIDS